MTRNSKISNSFLSSSYIFKISLGNYDMVMFRNCCFLLIVLACNRKSFASVIVLFSYLSFSLQCFWTEWQRFFACIPSVAAVNECDQYRMYFVDTLANSFGYILKFSVWEHDIPCALEINRNVGYKREHVEYCSSTTKNIISPLPQCLWSPNLAGWWLTMRSSQP